MKKLILLGIVSFAFFVLISAPASFLLPYINKSTYFQAQNAVGNIFAAKMQTTGKIDTLSYRINPWKLLLADLSLDVVATQGDNVIRTNVKIDLITQTIKLNQLTGRLNLDLLQEYVPELSTVEPRGYLSFNNVDVTWDDIRNHPIPQQLSGNIELLEINALEQDFGDYQLLIETQSSNIIGVLNGKESATTDTKIKLNLSDKKKQLVISGVITGKNENVVAILQQLNIGSIEHTIRY